MMNYESKTTDHRPPTIYRFFSICSRLCLARSPATIRTTSRNHGGWSRIVPGYGKCRISVFSPPVVSLTRLNICQVLLLIADCGHSKNLVSATFSTWRRVLDTCRHSSAPCRMACFSPLRFRQLRGSRLRSSQLRQSYSSPFLSEIRRENLIPAKSFFSRPGREQWSTEQRCRPTAPALSAPACKTRRTW